MDSDRRSSDDLWSTGTRCHAVLSALFAFAVKDEGVLAVNPCASLRRPRYKVAEARHLGPTEAKRMLAAAQGDPIEGAIILGLAGGLRIGETIAVRWGDIEGDGTVTVRRSCWGETKSGKVRSLTLPASANTALLRYRRAQAEQLLAVGIRQGPDTSVLTDAVGWPVKLSTFQAAFAEFCRAGGFDVTFHSLRHSNAIAMLLRGIDVKTAASRLGHSNPRLLLKTYSHYIRAAAKAAAEHLEAVLG